MPTIDDVIWAATACALARGDTRIEPAIPDLPIWPADEAGVARRTRLVLAEVERALAQDRCGCVAGPDEDQLLLMLDSLPRSLRCFVRSGGLPDLVEKAFRARLPIVNPHHPSA